MRVEYNEGNCEIIRAALNVIRDELDRLYWNKNQKDINSPFDNTGETYSNKAFVVRAYSWEDNNLPNFEYKDLRCYWYKHSNRGLSAVCGHKLTYEDIETMINVCCDALRKDFGERG